MRNNILESVLEKDRKTLFEYRGQLLDSMASALSQLQEDNIEQAKEHLDDVELIIQRMEILHEEKLKHERAFRTFQTDVKKAIANYSKITGVQAFTLDINFLRKADKK